MLEIEVRVEPDGRLDVRFTLPLWAIEEPVRDLRLAFADLPFEDGSAGGYGRFVRPVGDGEREGPLPDVFPHPGDWLRLHYRVRLEHHLAGPKYGLDDVPRPTSRGWAIVGRAFAPYEIRIDAGRRFDLTTRLTFHLPPGWVMTSTHGGDDTSFSVDGVAKAAHALYVVGDPARLTVEHEEARVRIVSGDFTTGELGPLGALVRRVLAAAGAELGPVARRDLLVVADRDPDGFGGGVIGGSVTVLSAFPPLDRAMAPAGVVTTHELLHLWNQTERSEEWRWMHEGFTRYWEIVTMLRADGATPEVAIGELLDTYHGYAESARATGRPLRTATGVSAYDGGAMVAFCADVELRARGTSLAAVHRTAREAAFPLVPERLLEEMDGRAPGLAARVDAWVSAPTPLDLRPCLSAGGWKPRALAYRGWTEEALVRGLLGAARVTPFGLRVLEALPGSPLRTGDVVLAAAGIPIKNLRRLESAVRGKPPGALVTLDVLRAGARLTVERRLPAGKKWPRPEREILWVEGSVPAGSNLLLEPIAR